ncbi:MAG: 4-hydroxybenzoate 3-monooxygenase [Rhodobacteraceae bacterium]|nr:4-hydroxybenzoate 3-monooxygenase [Paracoccaceae bacterium]
MKTQVAIIGGGPAGLLLCRKLMRHGISTVLLEKHTRQHVLSRVRAGVLESGTVHELRDAGVAQRLDRERIEHGGVCLGDDNTDFRIDFRELSGRPVTVYGQTEITRDLYEALDRDCADIRHECPVVEIGNVETTQPHLLYRTRTGACRLDADFIVACDGYHGVGRRFVPTSHRTEFERRLPYGWLGILAEAPPVHHELVYSRSSRGFALASMRSQQLSRYYIQVPRQHDPKDWSDQAFWKEFRRRLPGRFADRLQTGPSIEKSIANLRAFVCGTLRFGRLLLCGDAGHIVPPTGAKGLNLAVSDVHYASNALVQYFHHGDLQGLDSYSRKALDRVWLAMRFSWWMTRMLHLDPQSDGFESQLRSAEFLHLRRAPGAQGMFAENYAGLPY